MRYHSAVPPGDHAEVVRQLMDAFNRRDGDAALALMAPDVVFHPVSARALGRTEPFVGHAGIREYMQITEGRWDDLHVEIVQLQAAGDAVTVIGRARGRGAGGELNATAVWTWKLRDGLIAEGRVHSDTRQARQALGLTAEEPAQPG
jgi:ketosteroid isomerase-like protein